MFVIDGRFCYLLVRFVLFVVSRLKSSVVLSLVSALVESEQVMMMMHQSVCLIFRRVENVAKNKLRFLLWLLM